MTNGTTATFTVKNGAQGEQGPKGDTGGIQDVSESSTKGYIVVTNADGTTKNVPVGDPNALLTTGGTMTGQLISTYTDAIRLVQGNYGLIMRNDGTNFYLLPTNSGDPYGTWNSGTTSVRVELASGALYGAVWNDYAECREANTIEPGHVVYEVGDDTLAETYERMMPACSIISDTFGFAIGQTEKCKTPLAQAGRVLAYPFENRNSYKPGDAVCSGPNGTVSKMTQEEKINHPECIIGYVSCVPNYETWGEKDTKVNGRIWIKVI